MVLEGEELLSYVVPVLNVQPGAALTAVVGSPLWVDGKLVGALAGASRKPGGLQPEDLEAVDLLAAITSQALEVAIRYKEISESDARNRYQAYHDDLTGLANRSLRQVRLREALTRGSLQVSPTTADVVMEVTDRPGTEERHVALLLIDLYDFKLVNDTVGHVLGDELLAAIATRLVECVRETDTVARLSGDEFAVLVPNFDRGNLEHLARRLLQAVSVPVDLEGHSISMDASIGIAVKAAEATGEAAPESAATELLSNADVAMYEAKRLGKHSHVVFDQPMAERIRQRMAIGAELPRAVEAGDMYVHYQPIFDLVTRSVTGFEALLRWRHPRLGNVSPAEFIPLAEETGAIVPIGRWVLRQACAELRALRTEEASWEDLSMSINLSARQLRDPELVEYVLETLAATGIPPSQLTLEITESSLLQDLDGSHAKIATLGGLGVRIALDDFGTGYSSFAYLQQLQVHCLKIDKSFVDGLSTASGDGPRTEPKLVRSIAELSDALGLETVAEGIETEGQLVELLRLGCQLGQGFVFSPAVPPENMRSLLRNYRAMGHHGEEVTATLS